MKVQVQTDSFGGNQLVEVEVKLSRRNLIDLVAAKHGKGLHRFCEDGTYLSILTEDDEAHYEGRLPGPGLLNRNKVEKVKEVEQVRPAFRTGR